MIWILIGNSLIIIGIVFFTLGIQGELNKRLEAPRGYRYFHQVLNFDKGFVNSKGKPVSIEVIAMEKKEEK